MTGAVTVDSRRAGPGGLFVALPGEHVDGHDYAAGRGRRRRGRRPGRARRSACPRWSSTTRWPRSAPLARAVRRAGCPALTVVAVTGSSGKTSTKDLLAAVLAAARADRRARRARSTTRSACRSPCCRADAATRYLVLEMGARGPGHIAYLCRDRAAQRRRRAQRRHRARGRVRRRGTAIARAKGELVEALAADGVAVLNADDPLVAAMAARTPARVVRVGRDRRRRRPRRGRRRSTTAARPSFTLVTPRGQRRRSRCALHGEHHVGNALAAAAVGLRGGPGAGGDRRRARRRRPASRWRMEVATRAGRRHRRQRRVQRQPRLRARGAARRSPRWRAARRAGRRSGGWAVLGEMLELGDDSAAEHDAVGRLAAELGARRRRRRPGRRARRRGARRAAGGGGATRCADAAAAFALLRGAAAARRRRPRQGLARHRARRAGGGAADRRYGCRACRPGRRAGSVTGAPHGQDAADEQDRRSDRGGTRVGREAA